MDRKDLLEDSLKTIITYVKDATEFVKGEAPFVVQEILDYNIYKYALLTSVWGLLIGLSIFIVVKNLVRGSNFSKIFDCENDEDADRCLIVLLSGFLGLVMVLPLVYQILKLIKVVSAPRLFVIEYIRPLL